jgi:hypothetical protein
VRIFGVWVLCLAGRPEHFRGRSFHILKDAREIALVTETAVVRDFRQRLFRAAQQIARQIHSALPQQLRE